MTYQVTFGVPLSGTFVEVEVSAASQGRVCLAVDSSPAGGVVYLYPEEARRIADALHHAADAQEPK